MSKFRENIKGGRSDPMSVIKLMQHGLLELAHKEIQKGVGTGKYTSAHIQDGYIEFRSPGGDWLAEESADPEKLQTTMLRFARAMSLAANPAEERREYAKKLYKLVAPEGDSELALFSQYAAGELTAEQLKKRWAEKTIGTEKKMNQRWRLYQKVDGRWEPVPGAEWNGYQEDEVKNRVWAKYGREALDSGEYQLVNMGEQDWEVYDVKTGVTLEIVKGKSKGEVADAVFDKYVDQGIGFQVRPWEDPAKMTPRAKLAKRITAKKPEPIDYNYEIVNLSDVHLRVVDKFYADSKQEADKTFDKWLEMKGLPNDTHNYGYRPRKQETAVKDIEPNVAQNFGDDPMAAYERNSDRIDAIRQNATNRVGSWSIYDVTLGREISRMDNVAWSQADARANELEQSTGHNMSVRGLSENLSKTLIALKSSPWTIMEDSGPVEIRKSRMFDQTVAEKADQLPNLPAKIQEFLTFKSANPGQPWGKDTPFIAAGPLARALPKLRHVHLTRDLSLFYTIGGRDPIMIRLYGVFNHKESGTGTPSNINRQKSLARQLDNQFEAAMAENFADGKVNEVVKMPPVNMVFSNENLVDWAYNDAQEKQAQQLSALKTDVPTKVYDMGDHVRVFVLDDQGPVLYLALEKFLDGFKTNAVQIRPRGQGKNLGFKIYQAVSDTFQRPLYSDYTHTDASRLGIWKKLIDRFPDRIVGYDQRTKEDLPLSSTPQGPAVRGNQPVYAQRGTKDQSKPVTGDTRSRTRLLKFLPAVNENFADGKGPGRPGDSQRHGIPKGATMAQLEKASHSKGRKGQLARWQLNMRRGKEKAK